MERKELRSFHDNTSTRHLCSLHFHREEQKPSSTTSWNANATLRRASSMTGKLRKSSPRSLNNSKSGNRHQQHPRRRNNKPSPAAILMDQWESPMTTTTLNNNDSAKKNHNRIQTMRFEERQGAFCGAVVEYRNIWFEPDVSNVATEWRQAMQFQHPTVGNFQLLAQSEPIFAKICSLCHELFVTTALLAERENGGMNHQHQDSVEFLTAVLPFWEAMRNDRALLVKRYSAAGEQPQVLLRPETAATESSTTEKGNWATWIKSIVGGGGGAHTHPPSEPTPPPQPPIQLTAHRDPQYAPNHYHYNKLVGRLYFSFPPLVALQEPTGTETNDENQEKQLLEVLEQRASSIQRIFDQVPKLSSGNGGITVRSPVLTDKTVRLLVRAYQDIGTLDAAYKTEQVYHRYPSHRKGLLWYVLMSYLQVTSRDAITSAAGNNKNNSSSSSSSGKFSPKSASLATKRICELLSKQAQTHINPNEFQSCATIGFQSLANIAVSSLDQYHERVHALAALKFGSSRWEALLKPLPSTTNNRSEEKNLRVRHKDATSLLLLVQIFAKTNEDENLNKAKVLFDNMWKVFPLSELKESMSRSTFHSILEAMDKKRASENQQETNEVTRSTTQKQQQQQQLHNTSEFKYALGLFDKMMTSEVWYPNADTFNILFRLAEVGPQADQVMTRLELCRVVVQEYPIAPFIASKHALRAWWNTAKQEQNEEGLAMERALAIFQRLQISSKPLLFQSNPKAVSHIYDTKDAPSPLFYSLIWETCYHNGKSGSAKTKTRAVEIATMLYQTSKEESIDGFFSANAYINFLQCLALSGDKEEERLALVRDVFESASSKDVSKKSMNSSLLEALLDCLFLVAAETKEDEQCLALIQDIYDVAVSANDIPVMSERFLTLLGRVHPQLHERHLTVQQQKITEDNS